MAHSFADAGHDPDDNLSLPGWIYTDPEFLNLEIERVIRPSWQIVCHVSDLAKPGDYHTIDYVGESVIAIRGQDGEIRAFTNVCRHRAMRLVEGPVGCAKKLVCPYHAWTYDSDGRLTGVPSKADYVGLDTSKHGLAPVGVEIWRGFVFVRLEDQGGTPSVAEMMSPYEHEIAPYRFEDMRTISPVRLRDRAVNWKNVGDNYSDGLHIPVAHPGLTRLFGKSYAIEAKPWVDKMTGNLERTSKHPWEAFYQKHLPHAPHLPQENQRLWLYYKLWPNQAFDIYSDQIDFMQWLPVSPTECVLREMCFALPDDRREMKLVRYANWRINRMVNAEDTWLITRVQQGMASKSYTVGPLGQSEVCLRSFARKIRGLIPEARLPVRPAPGWSRRPRAVD